MTKESLDWVNWDDGDQTRSSIHRQRRLRQIIIKTKIVDTNSIRSYKTLSKVLTTQGNSVESILQCWLSVEEEEKFIKSNKKMT